MSTAIQQRQYISRNGQLIAKGARLRIQHCVGRYGQTRIDEGVVEAIDSYGGVTLKLAQATNARVGCEMRHLAAGEQLYVPLPGQIEQPDRFICNMEHHDFEHGHKAWADVI